VFAIIGLLKKDILWLFIVIFKALLKFIFQNANKKVSIHPPINFSPISNPFPKHQRTSSKLDCFLDQPITQALSLPFPHPLLPICPQMIEFCLICLYNPFPVIHCPVLVGFCIVHTHPPMLFGEKWSFSLYYSLHTNSTKCSAYCLYSEGCVGHIL